MTPTAATRVLAGTLALLLAACTASGPHEVERARLARVEMASSESPVDAAVAAGEWFLEAHLAEDGRIVRTDQGGDVVSEGQAYGMLVAVGIDDPDAFRRIWDWTRANLRRPDGLLAWRWADGEVADDMPATDADLDAAHALVLAAARFGEPAYEREAEQLAAAIVAHTVVEGREGPVAVAGPWATPDRWVNPSYGAPVAFAALAEVTDDAVWDELDDGARRVVDLSSMTTDLPPDWAVLTPEAVDPRGPPAGGPEQHGYDAARTATRFAIDCDPAGRALAGAMADEYRAVLRPDGHPPAVLALDGSPRSDHPHPVTTVAAAAALLAAGDREAGLAMLDRAAELDHRSPTYFGAAWVALGRLWLTTDRLGGCAGDG